MRKFSLLFIWVIILAFPVFALLRDTSFVFAVSTPARFVHFLQEGFGLLAFTLLFVQIILGAFMDYWEKKVGGWVFNFHVFEGILIYTIIIAHTLSLLLLNYFGGAGFDPYLVYVNVCLLCKTPTDYYYTIGRVSFWLVSMAVFAALFRKATPWLKVNWRKLHVFNYVVFLLIGVHGFLLGSNFRFMPFKIFAFPAYLIILGIVVFVELPRLYKNFSLWLRS